jgi:serine/threonine protein kinase
MSPEQARAEKSWMRAPIYFSFGVVLYEMATGRLPFGGQTTGEMLEAIFTQEPTAPVRLNPKVLAELERIIYKALEKDRNLRYQNAAEMRTDLQRLKRDTSIPPVGRASLPATAAATEARATGKRDMDRACFYHCSITSGNCFPFQTAAAANSSKRQDFACRSAVSEHEHRQRTGIFFRWIGGRADRYAIEESEIASDLAQLGILV